MGLRCFFNYATSRELNKHSFVLPERSSDSISFRRNFGGFYYAMLWFYWLLNTNTCIWEQNGLIFCVR